MSIEYDYIPQDEICGGTVVADMQRGNYAIQAVSECNGEDHVIAFPKKERRNLTREVSRKGTMETRSRKRNLSQVISYTYSI